MATEPETHRSRRALLGAALGGAAVVAAQSIHPLAVRAATDGNVILGRGTAAGENVADGPTIVTNTTDAQPSLGGTHAGSGAGLQGLSAAGAGVSGGSGDQAYATVNPTEAGVYGYCDTTFSSQGVFGETYQGVGVQGIGDWGVYGVAGSAGVVGDSDVTGLGVMGFSGGVATFPQALPAGVGVFAVAGSTAQVALKVSGKSQFSRSGRKSISSRKTSLKVTMAGVSTSSYVIATLQTSVSGCYVRAVVPAAGSFTIYLSKAPGKTVYVGFMVIN